MEIYHFECLERPDYSQDYKGYRFEPVPLTGYKWFFGDYYKRPRTTQERKQYFGHVQYAKELGVKIRIRKRRSNTGLANAWDDRTKSTCGHRSWKRHRKTQYRR